MELDFTALKLVEISRNRWGVLTDGNKLLIITTVREIALKVLHERTDTRQRNVPDK